VAYRRGSRVCANHGMAVIVLVQTDLGRADHTMEGPGCVHAGEEAWPSLSAEYEATPKSRV
jgi:hypothetical protein